MAPLKLQFDPELPHQVDAVNAVADLFTGLIGERGRTVRIGSAPEGELEIVEEGLANPASIEEAAFEQALLENLCEIQRRNGLEESTALDGVNFTVEMETGTGKTYVYLRTIFELHRRYGLSKFVIVVPSVAIREGTLASLKTIGPLLASSYNVAFDPAIDAAVYLSTDLGRVRQFAVSNNLQILVMNIQAFQRDVVDDASKANVINRPSERMGWRPPIEYLQAMRPVVVIDEPQNVESDPSKRAIARLNPYFTLRYSATPRHPYNRVYRLGSVDAFRQGLVKEIEVAGVTVDSGATANAAYVRLLKVDEPKGRARLELNHGRGERQTLRSVWVKRGDDLYERSDRCEAYADGYIVDDIIYAAGRERILFDRASPVAMGASDGDHVPEVQRLQIRQTIRFHLERELQLRPKGIKVLSLFFLDKVADYRIHEDAATWTLGPIGRVFEEELTRALSNPKFAPLGYDPRDIADLHDGYFSLDAKRRPKDTRGTGEGDASAYEKIMRKKEDLLTESQPLRFIFTHSALREGWDNPNVFQICTLTHQRSAITRRQQIGRGLRLPVNQEGERVHDRDIARLTVIANESYDAFAAGLQTEYEEDAGQTWGVVDRGAFAQLPLIEPAAGGGSQPGALIGAELSASIWAYLVAQGILTDCGSLTAKFEPTSEGFNLPMPEGLERCADGVTTVLEAYARPMVRNADRPKRRIRVRKGVVGDDGFKALWEDIARRTRYRVRVDTERIVSDTVRAIKEMPRVNVPRVRATLARIHVDGAGVHSGTRIDGAVGETVRPERLPDPLFHLQNETELTRQTLRRILVESDRLDDFERNPHAYLVAVTQIIRRVLAKEVTEGLTYAPTGTVWSMRQITTAEIEEVERYADRLYEVKSQGKSPHSDIEYESSVERAFVERLDADRRVRFFIKLPDSFTIDTPVGPYNPDWAVCLETEGGPSLHLVSETKSTLDALERREFENLKISAARKHFAALGVRYGVDTDFDELLARAGQ